MKAFTDLLPYSEIFAAWIIAFAMGLFGYVQPKQTPAQRRAMRESCRRKGL